MRGFRVALVCSRDRGFPRGRVFITSGSPNSWRWYSSRSARVNCLSSSSVCRIEISWCYLFLKFSKQVKIELNWIVCRESSISPALSSTPELRDSCWANSEFFNNSLSWSMGWAETSKESIPKRGAIAKIAIVCGRNCMVLHQGKLASAEEMIIRAIAW